jgi:cytochrome c peroxidase
MRGAWRAIAIFIAACDTPAIGPDAGPALDSGAGPNIPEGVLSRLSALSPEVLPPARPDSTNRFADDPLAARWGQQLFFDPRFSGPLLAEDNNGDPGTLGLRGESGRVSCASCHMPAVGFLDVRSSRRQISLGSGWTRRRSPSLLDFGQSTVLMWDGRRDTAYNQLFGVVENPLEFNSSRLFTAQQILRHYLDEYTEIFGPPPSLDAYETVDAATAGCTEMPDDPVTERCPLPGHDDAAVIEVLVNAGKAIGAYERLLTCGPSRFDAWMHGDASALSPEEQRGAVLFVELGCDSCHSGPYLSDQQFHNVGAANVLPNFIPPYDDPGAGPGIEAARLDPLNSRGAFSDGDDGRLAVFPEDTSALLGAFRTPMLRCVSRRPSFMHAGQIRSLEDAVLFFVEGGDHGGYRGVKDPRIVPLDVDREGRDALVAFLRALDGPGPDPALLEPPELPGLEAP